MRWLGEILPTLNAIDGALILAIAVAAFLGCRRGAWLQLVPLVALGLAAGLGYLAAPLLVRHPGIEALPFPTTAWKAGILGFALGVPAFILLRALLTPLARLLAGASPGLLDGLGGGLLGTVKALAILALACHFTRGLAVQEDLTPLLESRVATRLAWLGEEARERAPRIRQETLDPLAERLEKVEWEELAHRAERAWIVLTTPSTSTSPSAPPHPTTRNPRKPSPEAPLRETSSPRERTRGRTSAPPDAPPAHLPSRILFAD